MRIETTCRKRLLLHDFLIVFLVLSKLKSHYYTYDTL